MAIAAPPRVIVDLEIPLTDLDRASWIVTSYLISYTVAMPLAGRLSDVYGRLRMLQAALVLFSVGSAWVAVARNFPWMGSARVLQAFGGGAIVPIGLVIAVGAVARQRGGVARGLVAASAGAGPCRSDGEIVPFRTYCAQFYPDPRDAAGPTAEPGRTIAR